jgi:hypothetical protein
LRLLKQFVKGYAIGVALALAVLFIATYAHCSTTPKKSDTTCWLPEGCVTQYQDNPYTYKAGTVSTVGAPDDAIVIRIQPLATYSLFTEDILFCDADRVALLGSGKHNPVLLTYKTRASHMVQGIGCHDLVRVDEFKESKQ